MKRNVPAPVPADRVISEAVQGFAVPGDAAAGTQRGETLHVVRGASRREHGLVPGGDPFPATVPDDVGGAEGERNDDEHGDHGHADDASVPRRQRPSPVGEGHQDLRRDSCSQGEHHPERERVSLRRAQAAVRGRREQRSQVAQAEEDRAGQRHRDGERHERGQAAGREYEVHE